MYTRAYNYVCAGLCVCTGMCTCACGHMCVCVCVRVCMRKCVQMIYQTVAPKLLGDTLGMYCMVRICAYDSHPIVKMVCRMK